MSDKWMTQDWTTGELNALVKNLGEPIARRVQRGELAAKEQDGTIILEKVVKPLFDKYGRRIPEGLRAKVCDANKNLRLDQPKLGEEADFTNRLSRLHECLSINTGVTAEQLKAETERLLAIIRADSRIATIADGVYLPVVLPKLVINDLGAELELYLAGAGKGYVKTFGNRKFINRCWDILAHRVSTIQGSRHDQLIKRMKQGPVIGVHFPNSLQGFSVHADREQMSKLPEGFILSGLDTLVAMVMYPDILARDRNVPHLDLAALQWQSVDVSFHDISLYFEAYDVKLDFGNEDCLAYAYGNDSGGLLFLG
jgi:hypothetical protein